MTKLVQIELPWFPEHITSHNKGHWRSRVESVRLARDVARFISRQWIKENQFSFDPKACVWVEYVFGIETMRWDEANLIQCCKPYIDGVVDSGLIPGDNVMKLRTWGAVVEKVPKVFNRRISLRFMEHRNAFRGDLLSHLEKPERRK